MPIERGTTTLVLGGQASGKSDLALDLLDKTNGERLFLATGRARDAAFREQIMDHRRRRDPAIRVLEVSSELPEALACERGAWDVILADSLDFWLFTCLEQGCAAERVKALLDVLSGWGSAGPEGGRPTELMMVSQEAGLGVSPGDAASRAFVRELGALNRAVAQKADRVLFVAAGLPLSLKPAG